MLKDITVEFPDDFVPPDEFDGVERDGMTRKCLPCPFYYHDTYEDNEDCAMGHMAVGDECPIKKYFSQEK